MKKLFLAGAIAFGALFANAQEGLQGTWFAGGQLAFGNAKSYNGSVQTKTNKTTVLPIIGTFISPSVAVGAGVGYIGGDTKAGGFKTSKTSTFIVKPLVRKYWNVTGGLFFFGQIAAPLQFGEVKGYTAGVSDSKTKTTDVYLELSPGFDYVINKWLTIETSFTILTTGFTSSKPDGGKKDNSFNFDANPFNSVGDRVIGDLQVGIKFLF